MFLSTCLQLGSVWFCRTIFYVHISLLTFCRPGFQIQHSLRTRYFQRNQAYFNTLGTDHDGRQRLFKNAKFTFMACSCDLWLSFPKKINIHHALGVEICVIFAQNTYFSTIMAIKSKKSTIFRYKMHIFWQSGSGIYSGYAQSVAKHQIWQFEQVFRVGSTMSI